jgi:hypothetical protein
MSQVSPSPPKAVKLSDSLPPGWFIIGVMIGVIVTVILCGTLVWLDVPAALRPTPTPTVTPIPTLTSSPTRTPTITPTPASLDFGWSGINWEISYDNPAIAVGTIRLLIGGGFSPYQVLHNEREVSPVGSVFYITVQTPNCTPVDGVIEVQSADGQRVVRSYVLGMDDVPCSITPTATLTLTPEP